MKKIFVLILIIVIGVVVFKFGKKHAAVSSGASMVVGGIRVAAEQVALYPALDGALVDKATSEKRPVAVMVENHPDARPQSGLADADIVYETLAEGGITRFMAVFQTKEAKNIGPIRSARTYFADIANELRAVYAHVGGNSDVLANIKAGDYKNISNADQFFNDPYFHRITSRLAPHNVYSSSAQLQKLITAHEFGAVSTVNGWQFKNGATATPTATSIIIDFSLKDYLVNWKYDAPQNSYKRFLAGVAHKDAETGKQITAKNIVVQYVKTFPVQTDTPLSIGMDLTSGGKAVVFLDGAVTQGMWKKEKGRTRFYDQNSKEIFFDRGQAWVEVVPQERPVSWN